MTPLHQPTLEPSRSLRASPAKRSVDKPEASIKEYIHQSNLIEGYDDAEFDKQGMIGWKFINNQKHLAHFDIMHLQKILVGAQNDLTPMERGNYRAVQVWVGSHQPPNALRVPDLMRTWIDNVNADKLTPQEAHVEFERIHPFVDGNGRTGRMLMWWHELKRGETPTLILDSKKQDYYKWFKATEVRSSDKVHVNTKSKRKLTQGGGLL